jgi:alkylation response protein AidB-like acyl-CoA dehydrogenase
VTPTPPVRPSLEEFVVGAREWLSAHAEPRPAATGQGRWGEGSDNVAVFHDLSTEQERALIDAAMAWQLAKFDAGYGAITWPTEYGGAGLPSAYLQAFRREEARFLTPTSHETHSVTLNLIAPTIRTVGTPEQKERFLRPMLRSELLACQLFSEPGAGSDLAGLTTRAVRDGDEWILDGQKVWSSGAQYAQWGEIICRTDVDVPKHQGMTAFMVPMDAPGITVRPIRQMSGGSTFNEVFLEGVRISDDLRLGPVGGGWKVALTTLGFERAGSGARGGSYREVLALARWLDRTADPVVRQKLAELYTQYQVQSINSRRIVAGLKSGRPPGPEGSIAKLLYTQHQQALGDAAAMLLGPRLTADTGEWGTFAWSTFLLGAIGNRIAGGADQVQRNIIGERVLGLPVEPRVDRDVPFRDVPR